MEPQTQDALRRLPSVDELLGTPAAQTLLGEFSREQVVEAIRAAVGRAREKLLAGASPEIWEDLVSPEGLLLGAARRLAALSEPQLRRVINASGVVVHTNLGRSNLAPAAVDRVIEAARHYSNLEFDLDSGERGSRHDHVESLLCRLTGAEAGMVVNNNAAAVLLMLTALAAGREVIVSRGQLVEIGGSFRVPDIMRLSGARLVEVGTTNKTRISDFEAAVSMETALLLRVHTSNFKVVGFAEEVSIEQLAALADATGVPVADDLGSGALVELPAFRDEPSVASSLAAGAAVVSFSGDKLLGGPQAGVLLGRADLIGRLKKHPLARAMRVDKMTLAGLEGTLLLYQNPERAREEIPTLRYLSRSKEETRGLAMSLLGALRDAFEQADFSLEEGTGKAGGGSLPVLEIPSYAVRVAPRAASVDELAAALRRAPVPVVGRVMHDALHLDCLTVEESEVSSLADSLRWALRQVSPA